MATTTTRLFFHLTLNGSNQKVGKGVPVSTSSKKTCPLTCAYLHNGCYAESGPLNLHQLKVTAGERGTDWAGFLANIAALPAGQFWRHNQSGDLYRPGNAIGRKMLSQLVEASAGKKGYTYSHHKRTPLVIQAFKAATANGFTVNASCESEGEADAAMADGLRAVFVAPSTETRKQWTTAGGNRAVVCPAQRMEGMNCDTCRLCHARPSNIAIVFLAHGSQKKKVDAAIAAAVDGAA